MPDLTNLSTVLSRAGSLLAAVTLSERCSITRKTGFARDDAGAPIEGTQTTEGVRCCVVTLRDPVEVSVAGKPRGGTNLHLYLPLGTDVQDGDTVTVQRDGGTSRYEVVGAHSQDSRAALLTVYVMRRN